MSRVEQHIDTMPLRFAVMSYALSPLQTQPDVKYAYSNAGINTAGRIIEVVSRMPYEQFMQKRLFDPLGMKDTTFWPNAEQQTRLAKSYKPNAGKTDLEEITVSQLSYPLGDHEKRFPCPAGGLFSTAADTARFGQLILNGGTFDGKRLISESSVRLMSSTHTGMLQSKDGEKGYGFGLSTSHKLHGDSDPSPNGACGHGGAYATNLQIDAEHLVFVYMVQHAGYANKDGGVIYPAFQKAAMAAFGAQK
jgi:CubicO group peptidase (beta-lactamase class C family)